MLLGESRIMKIIDAELLNLVSEQAKAFHRLRMNHYFHQSLLEDKCHTDGSW